MTLNFIVRQRWGHLSMTSLIRGDMTEIRKQKRSRGWERGSKGGKQRGSHGIDGGILQVKPLQMSNIPSGRFQQNVDTCNDNHTMNLLDWRIGYMIP